MKYIKTKGDIKLNNKKYEYTLEKRKNGVVFLECKAAKISQEFLSEDLAEVLIDLPNLILAEKEYIEKATETIQFRVTPQVKRKIEKEALKNGFDNVSDYLRNNLLAI